MITKSDATSAHLGREFYFIRQRDRKVCRCRVTGKCRTWVTRPDNFKLPIKYGLYESSYIEQDCAANFYNTEAEAKQAA